jgi:oligoendopeptidase F
MAVHRGEFDLHFLDEGADLGEPPVVEAYYRSLESRRLESVGALEAWLRDWSELDAWLDEEESLRYVQMTCHTADADRERRYLSFIETVSPLARSWSNRLDRRLLSAEPAAALPRDRYAVLLRRVRAQAELFREENVPLLTEDDKLRQQYQKLVGGMTVLHDGRPHTLEEMEQYLESTDRPLRRLAWEEMTACWQEARAEIDRLYDAMVRLRERIAAHAGCRDYREYAFRDLQRFDYTPSDCEAFAAGIEQVAVPAAGELADQRRRHLGLDRLRPWDMAVDPRGRPPLRPFSHVDQLLEGCAEAFRSVAPAFAAQFDRMRGEGLLDLSSRPGKAPGGYMIIYEGRRLPFIFMNAVGTQDDVQTLLHEGGHAFHAFAAREEPLLALRDPPIEFAEVASMGMELLGNPHLGKFYLGGDLRRALADHLQGIIRFFPWMAMVDQFQHWVYTHADEGPAGRASAWRSLNARFNPCVDFGGLEDQMSCLWHRKNHPFTVPFYYVEYGIAQLGALGVWLNALADAPAAIDAYRRALALGGSRALPELFAAAGVAFDFSSRALRPRVDELSRRLAALDA